MDKYDSLNALIEKLSEQDMPVFSSTVMNVSNAVNSGKTSASDVANIILQDASLTSRVLKTVNTVHFNPTKNVISTVSRAVMVMGFDQVSSLALSMALIDNLSAGKKRDQLVNEMAFAFIAAIQAQELSKLTKNGIPEDIFVTTLLVNLGSMAFWAFGDDKCETLLSRINETNNSVQSEIDILGFPLSQLTQALCQSWSLGSLLDDYLHERSTIENKQIIDLGLELANAVSSGWESEAMENAINHVTNVCDVDSDTAKQLVLNHTSKAKELTLLYGSSQVYDAIVVPSVLEGEEDNDENSKSELVSEQGDEAHTDFLMKVMQEMTASLQEKPTVSLIIEMALEGMYRGLNMDRAIFTLINPDRKSLNCKFVLGEMSDQHEQALKLSFSGDDALGMLVEKQTSYSSDEHEPQKTLPRSLSALFNDMSFLMMPAVVKNKVIGVFFVDRSVSKKKISKQEFILFQQFCHQTNMALNFLALKG
ncbi:hypothetical protein LCGC14_2385070 [marine sediment metagenome]|uniref:HDOD domain-containing protein n=1 Tax=marine sediment metagenome TaxID=412755 RepID=A0A0F9EC58_9ZZZZ